MDFTQTPVGDEEVSLLAKRVMPDLTPLATNLTALSISGNRFTRVPACLSKLSKLEVLDISSRWNVMGDCIGVMFVFVMS